MRVPLDVELLKKLINWTHIEYFNNPTNWQVKQATFYYFDSWNKNDNQWGYAIVIPYQDNGRFLSVTKIIGTDGRIEQYNSGGDNKLTMYGRVAWLSDLPDLSAYAKKSDLPNLSNYVTMAQVTAEVTRVLTTAEF